MLFQPRIMKKTVRELRKNQGYTAKELAEKLKKKYQHHLKSG